MDLKRYWGLLKETGRQWLEDKAARLGAALAYYTAAPALEATNFVVSLVVITLLFAMIFKLLPDAEIAWRDVWIGAVITALLFTLGKFLLALHLGRSRISSTYGAAGSLVVLLVWVYYSAQIVFFGAEFTKIYADWFGSRIVPAENAVPVTAEARAQQGIPRTETLETVSGRTARLAGQARNSDRG
jgi:membrane protein